MAASARSAVVDGSAAASRGEAPSEGATISGCWARVGGAAPVSSDGVGSSSGAWSVAALQDYFPGPEDGGQAGERPAAAAAAPSSSPG